MVILIAFLAAGAMIAARTAVDSSKPAASVPVSPDSSRTVGMPDHRQPDMRAVLPAPGQPDASIKRPPLAFATSITVKPSAKPTEIALPSARREEVRARTERPAAPAKTSEEIAVARAESARPAEADSTPPVTIVGCLERDDDSFWLKNTSGAGISATRSWKTGFMRKRTPSIELIGSTPMVNLREHVGQRVAVTGTVTDRSMRMRSLESVAPSCS